MITLGSDAMTDRDYEILDYLEQCKMATTQQICKRFFSSKNTCQIRLTKLIEQKVLKRYRTDSKKDYMYALPGTKLTEHIYEHMLPVCQLYDYYEQQNYNVLAFETEVVLSKAIRADGVFVLGRAGKVRLIIVEHERSHNSLQSKLEKYEKYFESKEYQKRFPNGMPELLFLTDRTVPETTLTNVRVMNIIR